MTQDFAIGDKVRLVALPPYFKTAEPRPMLRPANLVQLGEEGIILDRGLGNLWSVRFQRGAYLIDSQYLERVMLESSQEDSQSSEHVLGPGARPLVDPEISQENS